mmetsp:Transcript_494/g.571  ORF Transcript_494/g.571 Transcript_494/m.571 type:complete len:90 (-) Transcript_494:265-534(-)
MSTSPTIGILSQKLFKQVGNAKKAREMQKYMKTSQPFYGVQAPQRKEIHKKLCQAFPVEDNEEYRRNTIELWEGSRREDQYIALDYADK